MKYAKNRRGRCSLQIHPQHGARDSSLLACLVGIVPQLKHMRFTRWFSFSLFGALKIICQQNLDLPDITRYVPVCRNLISELQNEVGGLMARSFPRQTDRCFGQKVNIVLYFSCCCTIIPCDIVTITIFLDVNKYLGCVLCQSSDFENFHTKLTENAVCEWSTIPHEDVLKRVRLFKIIFSLKRLSICRENNWRLVYWLCFHNFKLNARPHLGGCHPLRQFFLAACYFFAIDTWIFA